MALKHNIGSICFQVINKERSYETIQEKERNPGSLFTEYVNIRARGKRELGKLSTAELYEVAGRHFERFLKGRTCRLRDVTATLIADFHCFLQKQRLRTNSINSYLSSLRAVYNAALSEGLVAARENPFARLRLKREETVKRAISAEAIREMATLDLRKRPELERAADLSLFSFMAFGMPFVDIVNLRKENIQDGEIVYNRHKTGTRIRIGITARDRDFAPEIRERHAFRLRPRSGILGPDRQPGIQAAVEPAEPGLAGDRGAASGAEGEAHLLRHAPHMGVGGLGASRAGLRDQPSVGAFVREDHTVLSQPTRPVGTG